VVAMKEQLKKISSIALLFLFLFPIIEKGWHDAHHLDDAHCVATYKHFHTLEHSCSVCEFTSTNTLSGVATKFQFLLSVRGVTYHRFAESSFFHTPQHQLPSRAPPVV